MKQDSGSVLSLSFVDVFANSFASLLVLFFIMVALRGTLEWSQNGVRGGGTGEAGEPVSPFLVMVQAPSGALRKIHADDPWEIDNNQGRFVFRTTTGFDYAVLYADRPPPTDVVLRLRLTCPHPAVTVQVYEGGRALQPQKIDVDAESVRIQTVGGSP